MEYTNKQIVQSDNFLSNNHKKFINEMLLGNNFPYYINHNTVKKDGIVFLSHIILHRPEFRNHVDEVNSDFYESVLDILNAFTKKNKLKINKYIRICLNLTFNEGHQQTTIHQDHDFDHKQILICLNKCDLKSDTIVVINKKKIKLKHKQYRGFCFDNKPHYNIIPTKGIRLMLVATFV